MHAHRQRIPFGNRRRARASVALAAADFFSDPLASLRELLGGREEELETKIEAHVKREKELMVELEREKEKALPAPKLEAELSAERSISKELRLQLFTIQTMYGELKGMFTTAENAMKSAGSERDSVQKQLAEKTEVLRNLKADSAKQIDEAEESVKDMTHSEERLLVSVSELTAQLQEATREAERLSRHEDGQTDLQLKADATEKQLAEVKARLVEAESKREGNTQKLSSMEAELTTAKHALEVSNMTSATLFKKMQEMERKVAQVEQGLSKTQDAEVDLTQRLKAADEKQNAAAKDQKRLEEESVEVKQREVELRSHLVQVKNKNEELSKRVPLLEAENQELQQLVQRLSALEARESDRQQRASEINKSLAEHAARANRLLAMKERLPTKQVKVPPAAQQSTAAKAPGEATNSNAVQAPSGASSPTSTAPSVASTAMPVASQLGSKRRGSGSGDDATSSDDQPAEGESTPSQTSDARSAHAPPPTSWTLYLQ